MSKYTIEIPKEVEEFYMQMTEEKTMEEILSIMLACFREVILVSNNKIVEECLEKYYQQCS